MKSGFIATLATVAIFALVGCQSPQQTFTRAQISALQSQGFKNTPEGWTLGLSEKVLFENNKSTLTSQSKEAIKKIASSLSSVGLLHARMDGHTDNYGESSYNQFLSLKRAATVADFYAESGNIPRGNLTTQGLGEKYPIADNNTPQGRAENRRVSIVITAP
ncbi:OmpA family protein [Brenneria izadpanahii]|uniref:OmpA family protein n=1 Tax=Brenneria izadpanahii TaxID=2722756 RepID=A0ABX7UR97_9GAMM|nr:OmpA family protein [Brenneria izadpanahii]QTF07810.1 OmpA family protein [Brenneria izadpanahii]